MVTDSNLIVDGFSDLWGGVDSGLDATLIDKNKASFAVNSRFRGGIWTHRPSFRKVPLDFGGNTVLETRAMRGRFQVAGFYDPDNGVEFILASIGGRQFRFNVADDNSVQEITITQSILSDGAFVVPAIDASANVTLDTTTGLSVNAVVLFGGFNFQITAIVDGFTATLLNIDGTPASVIPDNTPLFFYDLNPASKLKAWCVQAEKWWVLQNNQNLPFIYDGAFSRRAASAPPSGNREVPIGNVMEYAMNRLAVALPDGKTFVVGDLVGSSSGVEADGRDAVLKFTQNIYQNTHKGFSVPQNAGEITAMRAIPLLDGALNQGPLAVFTASIAFTLQLPTDATTWANLQTPVQTVALSVNGSESQNSTILINGDIWYRSADGWRSFVQARRDFNTWTQTSKSAEMGRIFNFDDQNLLGYSTSAFFDGRQFMSASPALSPFGVFHRGFVPLDLNRVSGVSREQLPPAYDSLWTGLNVLQFVEGRFNNVQRCFAFSVNYEGKIELYEILKEGRFDDLGTGEAIRIQWSGETAIYGRTRQPGGGVFDVKRLEDAEMWIDDVFGVVDIQVWFRPMGAACWTDWRTNKLKNAIRVCATTNVCSDLPDGRCQDTREFKPQYRSRIGFGKPQDDCDRNMDRPAHTAEGWQFRFSVRGSCRIRGFRVFSRVLDESKHNVQCCPAAESTEPQFFFNTEQSFTAECPPGFEGYPVTITIPQFAYSVQQSPSQSDAMAQAAADALALAAATEQVQAEIVCTPFDCAFDPELLGNSYGIVGYVDGMIPNPDGNPVGAATVYDGTFRFTDGTDVWYARDEAGGPYIMDGDHSLCNGYMTFECVENVPTWTVFYRFAAEGPFFCAVKTGSNDPVGVYTNDGCAQALPATIEIELIVGAPTNLGTQTGCEPI